ncbi:conserved hypothetical protein [Beutenbergia cavernae DSM 12333]|uniref:Uncharacterized protein n=1 Tax=Beutenbergia cavernae (strain ATCC BAA-8 / DSM 12333 / CCUG 43141 / JCM 11478 / NBRC 16432 / NCIMB 13614 / HKI 0122) TaxID=471853 RepID=C5BWA4_BEUC1|nr:SHOCT domain-containing protein [Beutenbergia cavernae]ACQ78562.1 conserved hypothetical protein [Beutenbergia cavernae DSM 12333]
MDFFWLLIYAFLLFAYLMVLFQIIGDLFRDSKLSGWWKAVWIFFLIILPFLTALVYLIARGRGMGERQVAAIQQAKTDTDRYIQSVATQTSPAEQIGHAKSLLDAGTITQAEFDTLKAKALAS